MSSNSERYNHLINIGTTILQHKYLFVENKNEEKEYFKFDPIQLKNTYVEYATEFLKKAGFIYSNTKYRKLKGQRRKIKDLAQTRGGRNQTRRNQRNPIKNTNTRRSNY